MVDLWCQIKYRFRLGYTNARTPLGSIMQEHIVVRVHNLRNLRNLKIIEIQEWDKIGKFKAFCSQDTSPDSDVFFVHRMLCDSSMIITSHLFSSILCWRRFNILYEITTTFGSLSNRSRLF